MGAGCGYGKAILFGEHFVVYGLPAIASAVELKTTAVVEDSEEVLVVDETLNKEISRRKADPVISVLDVITSTLNLVDYTYKITLHSTIPFSSGMGSSAALSVSIIKAFNDHYGLRLTEDEINSVAYECERIFHKNPSGIDNSVATYGGLIWYKRFYPPIIERLKVKKPIGIVIGNTGIEHDTGEVVEGVARRRMKDAERYDKYFLEYGILAVHARDELLKGNMKEVGKLMNRNQRMLRNIEVSCRELDRLCDIALDAGAYGAKLTGAGRGGCMIALTPGKKLQEKVAEALETKAASVIKTSIGV